MMSKTAKKGGVFGATLLIAGTCTGSAMFGSPIMTGLGGFLPMLALTTLVWLCNIATSFLFVEAILGMPDGSNIISLTNYYFGKWGKYLIGIPFLVFTFIVMISYPASTVPFLTHAIEGHFHVSSSMILNFVLFGLVFACIAFLGLRVADKVNALLLLIFFSLLGLLIYKGAPFFQVAHIQPMNWTFIFLAAPIIFLAFIFNYILPSLMTYLHRDIAAVKKAVFYGITISYLTYLIWQTLIIGAIPEGVLWEAFERGQIIQQGLNIIENTPWLGLPAIFFATIAFVTALIGISISLIDILFDYIRCPLDQRTGWRRLGACLLFYIPVIFFAIVMPNPIFTFLDEVGGFLSIIFSGILPIALAWRARYHMPEPVPHLLPGEKPFLIFLLLITSYILYIQGIVLSH